MPEAIEDQVKYAYQRALQYIDSFHEQYLEKSLPAHRALLAYKAFDRTKDMSLVSRAVKPRVTDDKPCFDYAGNNVDGSLVSDRPGTFCISAFNIASKVHPLELDAQSTALMIHEISEVLGFNEVEAVEFQTQVYFDLLK